MTKKPNTAQLALASKLFEAEVNAVQSADVYPAAAHRMYEKMFERLAPLLGVTGTRELFVRALKLNMSDFGVLRSVDLDDTPGERLIEHLARRLEREAPESITAITTALCATLLALLGTLIGERLTFQVLRSAWPSIDMNAAYEGETK